jgi:hypothetical protein
MLKSRHSRFALRREFGGYLLVALVAFGLAVQTHAQDRKVETIDARAMGTSTQMGKNVGIQVRINQFSTDQDREVLVNAFKTGQNKGLVDALEKMKPLGRIAITGTVGYDLSYIRAVPTSTGRKIRFVTNRPIRFGEAYNNGPSTAYNLTAGEIEINDADKNKNSGVLLPATQLIINKDGQLQFDLRKNLWKLVNIIDWNGAGQPK